MHPGRRYVPVALAAVVLPLGLLATAGVAVALGLKERRSAAQAMVRRRYPLQRAAAVPPRSSARPRRCVRRTIT
ncbi:hypothetical protein ACPPVO_39145 [Dactylosporangium sp. McL0621]|uniref:hypothetical protein n=1 Tax=Dactylosporangium sp. McL0621 TaxID=3415678 RepID=UPI003CF20CDF